MTKQHVYLVGTLVTLLLVVGGFVYIGPKLADTGRCLQEGEVAEYAVDDQLYKDFSTVTVYVKNADTGEVIREFTKRIAQPVTYHPVEVRECGVYFLQNKNDDYKSPTKPPVGFESYLSSFDYSGSRTKQILISEKPEEYIPHYSRDFRVSSDEKFIALEDDADLANIMITIKNLTTLKDAFVLPIRDIRTTNANVYGTLGLIGWTQDGRYFWADLSDGAYVNGWVRIDTSDWSYDVYEAPTGILGGHPLDINTGWVTLVPGTFWTGVAQDTDIIRQERLAAGQTTSSLYLYNLFTKEKRLVQTFNDPVWDGWPHKWLDEHTLQYTMPNGEVRTYTVQE